MNPSRTHNFHHLKPLLNTYVCHITFCFCFSKNKKGCERVSNTT